MGIGETCTERLISRNVNTFREITATNFLLESLGKRAKRSKTFLQFSSVCLSLKTILICQRTPKHTSRMKCLKRRMRQSTFTVLDLEKTRTASHNSTHTPPHMDQSDINHLSTCWSFNDRLKIDGISVLSRSFLYLFHTLELRSSRDEQLSESLIGHGEERVSGH